MANCCHKYPFLFAKSVLSKQIVYWQVFRTPKKGWAVRSWDFIPSGAPICEYTGILRRTEDVDSVLGNDYIFEIDCLQTMKGLGGREVSAPQFHSITISFNDVCSSICFISITLLKLA